MAEIFRDPDGYSPEDIINRLKLCIDSGVEGIDYTIIPREKNEDLLAKYCITTKKRKDILKSLTADNFVKWDYSNNDNFKGLVYIFEKSVSLIPRYVEDAIAKEVDLYIKFSWNKQAGNFLVIISFHENER